MDTEIRAQDIIIRSREKAEINGVIKVVSFDEGEISLESVLGDMIIEGRELFVNNLDTDRGVIYIEGKIDGVYYVTNESTGKKSFFGRLMGK